MPLTIKQQTSSCLEYYFSASSSELSDQSESLNSGDVGLYSEFLSFSDNAEFSAIELINGES